MEREIIFRGKRLDSGEWVEGHLLAFKAGQINPNRSFILPFASSVSVSLGAYTFGGFVEVDPATVGQYTGLPDKTGKKIFEGDILKWDEEWPGYCEVAMWDYELLDMRKNDWEQFCEVIGNRWDNPELLEVKK